MNRPKTKRIESLDILKGMVIIFMALDHTRDYFHTDSFLFDPADPEKSNLLLFFTRWITHFCAPAFSFLAGISAFLVGRRKTPAQLSSFLLKRGLWLIFIEFTIVYFGWSFNISFSSFGLLVIWSLGISMIVLAAIVHLSMKRILILSLVIIFGHHLLDNLHYNENLFWSILHERSYFTLFDSIKLRVVYPIIPWIGVMSLGYYFGKFYDRTIKPEYRQQRFTIIGLACIAGFFILRGLNLYGNSDPWMAFDNGIQTLISFMDPDKYPPSLTYLLMTLGPSILFLGTSENLKGRLVNFCTTFGKVPFFFYIVHIYAIHLLAILLAEFTDFGYESMILSGFVSTNSQLIGFGVNLGWVYLIWLSILLMLYPICLKFGNYKMSHKHHWWLSYF
ncbi:DUF1624 domain-containing protein [Aestuariivivens sediminicola]|uniref:DUF1624 domain-containing protein n=1 Tax=Aestuariivivens sediminicola TaxID=2913560 RepID=UPI001F5AD552|nr:heparan-alpha-glucosaminide N-acetyltransferase domain-containing protein [Aestuariivivens sediminicola]